MAQTTATNQYLTFSLGKELYAMDVANVREILEVVPITKIPRTPDFLLGVINNRGSVVPVIDLRSKFAMEKAEQTAETRVIVTEVEVEEQSVVVGLLADAVDEVIRIEPDQIQPPPKIGTTISTELIKGIGKKEESFILILDTERLFTFGELSSVREAGAAAAPAQEA